LYSGTPGRSVPRIHRAEASTVTVPGEEGAMTVSREFTASAQEPTVVSGRPDAYQNLGFRILV